MKTEAAIVPGNLIRAMRLGDSIRPEDRAELEACGYTQPHAALVDCLRLSVVSYAAEYEGEVGAMFGCGPLLVSALSCPEGRGQVWFITGKKFAERPRAFMRPARAVMAQLLELYPVLENFIDARYEAAVRWAKWLGFDVREPVPYGPAGMPFHPARLERAWVG